MAETRKLAAILPADVAGYSKLAGADEERTLLGLRALLGTSNLSTRSACNTRSAIAFFGGGAPGDQQKAATSAQRHGRGRQTAA
jgi:hypothetical protein